MATSTSARATYGGVIPVGFGVQKVAGAMIWATDIDEDKNTRKEGGSLFGGGQKIVEYRYFANFAVAFGEGPAGGVLRIWAGDRLIADLRAGAGAYANHPKYRFRIYLGTEDQEPDRLIRQHVENSDDFDGEDATPAFRGLVYIVFEDLPLDEFGNRIPPITAEIAWAGAPQAVVKDTTFLSAAGYFTSSAVLDSERGFLYLKTSPDGIGRIRTSGMVEDLRVPATELGIDLAGVKAIDSRGDLYVTHGITEQSFRKIDGDTLQVVASASFSSQVELATVSAYTLTGRIDFVLALGFLSAPARIFFADDLSRVLAGTERLHPPGRRGRWPQRLRRCEAWFAAYPSIVLARSDRHGQHPARPDGAAVHGQPGHRLSRDREAQSDHARRQRVRRGRADHRSALLRRAERSAAVHQRARRRAPPGLVQRREWDRLVCAGLG